MSDARFDRTVKRWRIEDWFDFDHALRESFDPEAEGSPEDRAFYRRYLDERGLDDSTPEAGDRNQAFRGWLEERRKDSSLAPWPGALLSQGKKLLGFALILLALVAGSSAAGVMLRYDGREPVNVFHFLLVLLGIQWSILLLAFGALAVRKITGRRWQENLVVSSLNFAFDRVAAFVRSQSQSGDTGHPKDTAWFHSFSWRNTRSRALLSNLTAGMAQGFGVWFNLAAIATTLLLVTFSDRAFGWQSSLDLSSDDVHRFIGYLAAPWSFLGFEFAPALDEIEGSRIRLKDGILQLESDNLTSWWPFLVASLTVWGLIPRIGLRIWFFLTLHRRLRRLPFDSLRCDQLWNAMTSRYALTGSFEPEPSAEPALSPDRPVAEIAPTATRQPALLLAEAELSRRIDRLQIDEAIRGQANWIVEDWITFAEASDHHDDFWSALSPWQTQNAYRRLAILHEAFQPPIQEFLELLQELNRSQSRAGKIYLFLVGLPGADLRTEPVERRQQKIWTEAVQSLGSENLAVTALKFSGKP